MDSIDRHKLSQDFQKEFSIEKLRNLTLEEYTNLNKDNSFCYWIESKTDPLGSFWGGSSYKLGIYKYNKIPDAEDPRIMFDDENAWYSKYGATNREEAFQIVKETIIKIAEAAKEGKYEIIDEINELGNSYKWKIAFLYSDEKLIPFYKKGYLFTIAEELGQEFKKRASVSKIQRYLMSQQGDKDIYEFADELWKIVESKKPISNSDDEDVKYWIYAPGDGASEWQRCLDTSTICLGWDELGDYRQFNSQDEIRDKLREYLKKPNSSFKNDSLAVWNFLNTIKPGDVIIAKKGIDKILGRGIVDGDYEYDENQERYPNIRKVKWINTGEWDAPKQIVQKTLTDITSFKDLVKQINGLIGGKDPKDKSQYWWLVASPNVWKFSNIKEGETIDFTIKNDNGSYRPKKKNFENAKAGDLVIGYESTPHQKIVALLKVERESNWKDIIFRKLKDLRIPLEWSDFKDLQELEEMEFLKNQMGTLFKLSSEEYKFLIHLINNIDKQNPPIPLNEIYTKEDFLNQVFLSEDELKELINLLRHKQNIILQGAPGVGKTFTAKRLAYLMMEEKDQSRVDIVQFHQNFSYEDFIMGYKPTPEGAFELIDGKFIEFCRKAKENPENDYFFIIDEINRGNLSKIFGELLMLIEKGYRGEYIELAYNKQPFAVPKNIYLIGMMNTADRSLAMIDYALRRRFAFFPMQPGFDKESFRNEIAKSTDERVPKIIEAVKKLNEEITKDDTLGDGFCIGHSYFCDPKPNEDWIENIVKYEICPMLDEYWFDNKSKADEEKKKLLDLLK